MSPGLGATAGATAGALGFMGTRGLLEGMGEPWRFSATVREMKMSGEPRQVTQMHHTASLGDLFCIWVVFPHLICIQVLALSVLQSGIYIKLCVFLHCLVCQMVVL